MKRLLHLLIFLSPCLVISQEISREVVSGVITAPAGEDVEGISVYNISSEMGTITDASGKFKISVAKNDRIQITALQYHSFTVIINESDIKKNQLSIYLNPNVNQLEEVTVRSTNLTGIAELDAKSIKTSVYIPDWDLSLDAVRFGYNFERDQYTNIQGNAAEEALGMNSIPMASVSLQKLAALFFPKKKKSSKDLTQYKRAIIGSLSQMYPHSFYQETFNIPSNKVNEFIYFVEDSGLDKELLKPKNEVRLLAYLFKQCENYKTSLAVQN